MEINRNKPVLVTGGNGYIASWLVRYLLEEGIDVHATVRNPDDDKKVGHLRRIAQNTPGRLTLFKADLLDESAFDAPIASCELVFHTASPFLLGGITDPQRQLVDPAVKGTQNVLNSVGRTPQVKRVVLTSSVAAVHGDNIDIQRTVKGIFTEADWNTTSSLTHQAYSYSKTLAERAAWDMAGAQERWDLVVINPAVVVGPSLTSASDSGTFELMNRYVNGSLRMGAPALSFGFVDVRDVATAHLKAGFIPGAHGRHLTVSETFSLLELSRILQKHFGRRYPFPRSESPKPIM